MTSTDSPTLINDFAVAEYNNKINPKKGITPNNICSTIAKLDEYEHFSFVVNERYLFLINVPYYIKKIDGADYVENHLYKEIYKNAYLISKPEEEDEEEDEEEIKCYDCGECDKCKEWNTDEETDEE